MWPAGSLTVWTPQVSSTGGADFADGVIDMSAEGQASGVAVEEPHKKMDTRKISHHKNRSVPILYWILLYQ